jgi:sec-independent protein translocase protein TatB
MVSPQPIMMANIGMADTLIIMVLALVVFGPRRLPQIGRQIGKLMYEFRKASNDFKFQMEEELRQAEEADRRKKEEAERQRVLAAAPPPPQIAPPAESPIQSTELASPASPPEPPAEIAADIPAQAVTTSPDSAPDSSIESPLKSEPAASTQSSESKAPTELPHPRIAPPTTGEKVAAERPGAQPQQRELFAGESGKAPESVAPEAERSEPAAHHG